ncbi:MAG: hypothetical protein WC373_01080 [Smithella sp.]|jgi:hypothetical protein
MEKTKFKLFGKTKKGNKRTLHIFGIKINYKKKNKIDIYKDKTQKKINEFKKTGITRKKRNPKLIVSLTSFPQRMCDIHFALYSLLNQTLKPDEVVLWLGDEQFPNKEDDLPQSVLSLKDNGLTIKWCTDIKSYKKLIPALREFPDDIIVTVDDDNYYSKNSLELLYNAYLKEPQYIHCHRARRIIFDENNNVKEYLEWPKKISNVEPSFCNFLTGVGGVLYPPKVLYKDILDEELFFKLSPTNDDIWFWAMAVLNNTKINIVKNNRANVNSINPERKYGLKGEITLSQTNQIGGGNDKQLKNIFNYYPNLPNTIKKHNSHATPQF